MDNAAYEITDLNLITEELANVKLKRRQGFESFTRRGNVVLGAHVTAYARIFMHENILKVQKARQIPLYMDTDSIIVAKRKNQKLALELDQNVCGKFKLEKKSGSIKYYYSLGCVYFIYTYKILILIAYNLFQTKKLCPRRTK